MDTVELGTLSDTDVDFDNDFASAHAVIEKMEQAWLNEKFAPEILPHKYDIVECLLGQISHIEENIQALQTADFQKTLHQMQVHRLRFMVASYLRTRLEKIEAHVHAVLSSEEQRMEQNKPTYLTNAEFQFAREYKDSIEQHFDEVMQFIENRPDSNDWRNSVVPNMNKFVFAKTNSAIEGVRINSGNNDGEDDFLDLNADSQVIISYDSIANLVKDGHVQLI